MASTCRDRAATPQINIRECRNEVGFSLAMARLFDSWVKEYKSKPECKGNIRGRRRRTSLPSLRIGPDWFPGSGAVARLAAFQCRVLPA